jgi:uncharacterized protein (TIGR02996 family)
LPEAEVTAFLAGIRASAEDAPRLAFADWLEEHGETDYAEYIRVQCELEPIRDRYDIDRAAGLHLDEEQLLRCGARQDNALARLFGERWFAGIYGEFRCGFFDHLALTAGAYLTYAARIGPTCPTLRRIKLFCVNGHAGRLAACEHLRGLPELELACWYPEEQARALTTSPHLANLEVLVVWLGGASFLGSMPADELVRLFAAAKAWPNLRELTLFDCTGEADAQRLVKLADKAAKRPVARFVRPLALDGRLPFAPGFRYFCPGKLADGRRVAAKCIDDAIHVLVFGPDDRVAEEYDIPQPKALRNLIKTHPFDFVAHRRAIYKAISATPAFIRVFPFSWPDDEDSPYPGPGYHFERWKSLGVPDEPDEADRDSEWGFGGVINWIAVEGQYGCGVGWCDKRGLVHST